MANNLVEGRSESGFQSHTDEKNPARRFSSYKSYFMFIAKAVENYHRTFTWSRQTYLSPQITWIPSARLDQIDTDYETIRTEWTSFI